MTEKKFIKALQGTRYEQPPFWLMRQAGRYLPEYRELRAKAGGFLDMVYNSQFATEVTMQPLRRFGMDAAILFSDILVIPHALGQKLEFVAGEGPKLDAIENGVSAPVERLVLEGVGHSPHRERPAVTLEAVCRFVHDLLA